MPRVCILTDKSAQFTHQNYPGYEHVFQVPFALERVVQQGEVPLLEVPELRLLHPSTKDYQQNFQELIKKYDSILVLTLSSHLLPLASQAQSAISRWQNHADIQVLDSHTVSIGLGWLVEQAAEAIHTGESCQAIIKRVQEKTKGIYFLFFIPDLGALVNTNHISPTQAMAASILEMLPIFMLEDGKLVPVEKAKSPRAVMEYFMEFLDEFQSPSRVALVHASSQAAGRLEQLRQHILTALPETHYSEHALSSELKLLLGNESIGMAIMH